MRFHPIGSMAEVSRTDSLCLYHPEPIVLLSLDDGMGIVYHVVTGTVKQGLG